MIKFMLEAFLLALALDLVFGEPNPAFHPVVWTGKLIGLLDRCAPHSFRRLYGIMMALFCISLTAAIGYGLTVILYMVSPFLSLLATAYLLKSTFSLSFLWQVSADIFGDCEVNKIVHVGNIGAAYIIWCIPPIIGIIASDGTGI